MKVLILDAIHGADILAERYIARGDEVVCVDVYRKAIPETIENIKRTGAGFTDTVPAERFDLVVMPCHCPDSFLSACTYGKRIFFFDAVRDFIDDSRFRIEVTGAKGKTSTCFLLAAIIASDGKRVFLHTSRGQGPWEDGGLRITDRRSIAPTSLLTLPKGDYDAMVCEISLGGSGKANIAGITNLQIDYGIAANTRFASEAKRSILTDGINVVKTSEMAKWQSYRIGNCIGYSDRVEVVGKPEFGRPVKAILHYMGDTGFELSGEYLSLAYIDSMNMAVEICRCIGISKEAVIKGLSDFRGVPGRGEIYEKDGVKHIIERNPGISAISVDWTLGILERLGVIDDAVMLVDPISKKVCDKMDAAEISEVADRYGVQAFFTSGDGKRPEMPKDKGTIIEFVKEGYQ